MDPINFKNEVLWRAHVLAQFNSVKGSIIELHITIVACLLIYMLHGYYPLAAILLAGLMLVGLVAFSFRTHARRFDGLDKLWRDPEFRRIVDGGKPQPGPL